MWGIGIEKNMSDSVGKREKTLLEICHWLSVKENKNRFFKMVDSYSLNTVRLVVSTFILPIFQFCLCLCCSQWLNDV